MANNLPKEVVEKISNELESFNNALAILARNKIMKEFFVGDDALDLIGKNVNGIKQNGDDVTKKILGSYHVSEKAAIQSQTTPSAGPKPSGPSNSNTGPSSVAPQ